MPTCPPHVPEGGVLGDPAVSLEFLRWARPDGPWVLTAIPPEGGVTKTATFSAETTDALLRWVREQGGTLNVYWMVNPARRPLTSKAKKEDVEAMEFLHVDLDPVKPGPNVTELAAHNAAERTRILGVLETFSPSPSAIVDSGGGYQAFWRLEKPIHIGGSETLAIEGEAYNQQLGIILGGDATHNADRIMRLPGTVNHPDEKKRKKGRVERLSTVISVKAGSYPLSAFTPAPKVQGVGGGSKVSISSNLPFLKDLDELPDRVSPKTRMLIVQGADPDDPTKYGSRSDVVWAVTCELVRAGCEDDMIAAVLLDPDFGISAHVRDQNRPAEYAARQIQRAREEVASVGADSLLIRMNGRFCVVSARGKARVLSVETGDEDQRQTLVFQAFDDFKKLHDHRRVPVGEDKTVGEGTWWLAQSRRRQYDSVVFRPGKSREVADGQENVSLNLWLGWGIEPRAGDWSLLQRHIKEVLAAGDEALADYIFKWTTWTLQNPGTPAEVALVFRGGKGTGKSLFGRLVKGMFGQHGYQISSTKHLTGTFNAHLMDCALLFADEAFWAGDRAAEGTLKRIITEPTLFIEPKGIDAFEVRNCLHVIMATNDDWAVPASIDERRFAVSDVAENHKGSTAYFKPLYAEIEAGGAAAMMFDLLARDLDGWHPREDVPQTLALAEQKVRSLRPEDQWWLGLLQEGQLPGVEASSDPCSAPGKALYEHARSTVPGLRRASEHSLAGVLKKRGCYRRGKDYRIRGSRAWIFPPLAELRRAWTARLPTEWETPDEWAAVLNWVTEGEGPPY